MIRGRIRKSIEKITDQLGVDIVYRRRRKSVPLRIVPVGTEVRSDTMPGSGGFFEGTIFRYLIERSKLFFDAGNPGSAFLPEPGDTFERDGRKYRVCVFQGETAWKDNDVYGIGIEFHVEEVKRARKKTTRKTDSGDTEDDNAETGESFFSP